MAENGTSQSENNASNGGEDVIPILNNSRLTIQAAWWQTITVEIWDSGLGAASISYETKNVRLSGVDLRVSGQVVGYTASSLIKVRKNNGGCLLCLDGVNLQIEGLRTIDARRVTIQSKTALKVRIDKMVVQGRGGEYRMSKRWWAVALTRQPWWWYLLLFVSFSWMVAMTALPVLRWDTVASEFQKQLEKFPQAKIEKLNSSVSAPLVPSGQTVPQKASSKRGDLASGLNNSTNVPVVMVVVSSQPKGDRGIKPVTTDETERVGYGLFCVGVTLFAVMYFILYLLGVGVFVLSCRAVKRHRKLYGDISGIIEALRAERDKTARDKMKKRILDNLVSTYLGENSDE